VVRLVSLSNFEYRRATAEVFRIDAAVLRQIGDPAKLSALAQWQQTIHVRFTEHAQRRCREYGWGNDPELTPSEEQEVKALDAALHSRRVTLVELGFNAATEICKAAYVLRLASQRHLFFCLGMDGGLKTFYVTQAYKHRPQYRGCRYLTAAEAQAL